MQEDDILFQMLEWNWKWQCRLERSTTNLASNSDGYLTKHEWLVGWLKNEQLCADPIFCNLGIHRIRTNSNWVFICVILKCV